MRKQGEYAVQSSTNILVFVFFTFHNYSLDILLLLYYLLSIIIISLLSLIYLLS